MRIILLLFVVSILASCSSPTTSKPGTVWHQFVGGTSTLTLYADSTAMYGPIPASYGTYTVIADTIYKVSISQVYPAPQPNSEWFYTLTRTSPDTLRGIASSMSFNVGDTVAFWK